MEKFSYALEFYYRKIFDLKNVDLFSKKVNEATKVENYFSKKILNLEYLREYIIKSYLFEPELEEVDRINYIKGLIYASDIIDYEDALKFFNDLNKNLYVTKKMTLWEQMNYMEDTSDDDFLHGMYNSARSKYIVIYLDLIMKMNVMKQTKILILLVVIMKILWILKNYQKILNLFQCHINFSSLRIMFQK